MATKQKAKQTLKTSSDDQQQNERQNNAQQKNERQNNVQQKNERQSYVQQKKERPAQRSSGAASSGAASCIKTFIDREMDEPM